MTVSGTMRIPVRCHRCEKQFGVPQRYARKRAKCPCGNVIPVPDWDERPIMADRKPVSLPYSSWMDDLHDVPRPEPMSVLKLYLLATVGVLGAALLNLRGALAVAFLAAGIGFVGGMVVSQVLVLSDESGSLASGVGVNIGLAAAASLLVIGNARHLRELDRQNGYDAWRSQMAETLSDEVDAVLRMPLSAIMEEARASGQRRRILAVVALGERAPQRSDVVQLLIATLADGHLATRCAAAQSLGKMGEQAKQAIPDLKVVSSDPVLGVYARKSVVQLERPPMAECPHGHGELRDWNGVPRCWECGWQG